MGLRTLVRAIVARAKASLERLVGEGQTPTQAAAAVTSCPVVARPTAARPRRKPQRQDGPSWWRTQPLGLIPDGLLASLTGHSRNQVHYARTSLGIGAGAHVQAGRYRWPQRPESWQPWVAAWGRDGVREWLGQHGSQQLLETFERHMDLLDAGQTPVQRPAPTCVEPPQAAACDSGVTESAPARHARVTPADDAPIAACDDVDPCTAAVVDPMPPRPPSELTAPRGTGPANRIDVRVQFPPTNTLAEEDARRAALEAEIERHRAAGGRYTRIAANPPAPGATPANPRRTLY